MAKSNYGKNLGKSAKYAASKIVYTTMPDLYNTVNYTKEAFNDIRDFTIRQKNRIVLQRRRQSVLFKPVQDIINNAKEDLKSGKLYNEDRINEMQMQSMDDFLDYADDNTDSSSQDNGLSMSAFNNIIATTSAGNMMGTKTISENQLKSSEYLGELHQTMHTQSMVFGQKQHLETMGKLTNLETIGKSLVEFNVKTMNEHIKQTHRFYDEILNETRELKDSLNKISKNIDSRYGGGGKFKSKKYTLGEVFAGNGFNIKAYGRNIKNNALGYLPIDGSMLKEYLNEFKASPISALFTIFADSMIPKRSKKSMSKLDSSIQSLFTNYIQVMESWRSGKKSGSKLDKIVPEDLQMILGDLLGINLKNSNKPNLSLFKEQALDRNLELKKAKAITEVIPQYLSEITKTLTGKNMYFDMDEGIFKDRDKQRAKNERYINSSVASGMDTAKNLLYYKVDNLNRTMGGTRTDLQNLEDDIDTFLAWIVTQRDGFNFKRITNTEALRKEYQKYTRMGLNLRGGFSTYRVFKEALMKLPKSKIAQIKNERINAKVNAQMIYDRFNDELQSTGQSTLYNEFDTIKKKERYKLSYDINSSKARTAYLGGDEPTNDFYREMYDRWNAEHPGHKKENPYSGKFKDKSSKKKSSDSTIRNFANAMKMGKVYDGIKGAYDIGSFIMNLTDNVLSDIIGGASDYISTKGGAFFGDDDKEDTTYDTTPSRSKASFTVKRKSGGSTKNIGRQAEANIRRYKNRVRSSLSRPVPATAPNIAIPEFNIPDYTNILTNINDNIIAFSEMIQNSIFNTRVVDFTSTSGEELHTIVHNSDISFKSKLNDAYTKTKNNISNKYATISPKVKNAATNAKNRTVSGAVKVKDKSVQVGRNLKIKGKANVNKFKSFISSIKSNKSSSKDDDSSDGGDAESSSSANINDGIGFFGKSKNLIMGSILSSMLGLGPVPGLIISSIINKFKGKKKDKKASGKIGTFFGKGKNLGLYSTISSMLGLGPIPGFIVGSIVNRAKYGKKEKKEPGLLGRFFGKGKNLGMSTAISSALGLGPIPGLIVGGLINKFKYKKDNTNKKEPGAIKQFFGKGKNIGVGAILSSILGLGPIPGIIGGSIYNKFRYKKKSTDNVTDSTPESDNDKFRNAMGDATRKITGPANPLSNPKKLILRDKRAISDVERMRKAEMAGNQAEADRLESSLLTRARSTGDIGTVQKTTDIVANTRNQLGSELSDKKVKEKRAPNILDRIKSLLGGGGGILDTLKSLLTFGAAAATIYKIYNVLTKYTGLTGEDVKETAITGTKNFVDSKGNINKSNLFSAIGGGAAFKAASKLGYKGSIAGSAVGGAIKTVNQFNSGEKTQAVGTGLSTGLKVTKSASLAIAKNAIKKGTKANAVKGPLSKKIIGLLRKTLASKMVQKLFVKHPKLYESLIKKVPRIAEKVATETTEAAAKNVAKKGAKTGINAAIDASSALGIGIVINVAIGIVGFINGWNNVRNYLRLDPKFEVPLKLKAASAIITCIDEAICNGIIDMFGLRNLLIEGVYRIIASKDEREELTESKKKQSSGYKKFVNANPGTKLTEDQYNKITNKTLWAKFTSSLGFGKTLKDYETSDGGVTINNIDNSNNANVVVGGGSNAAGGRGINSKSSAKNILQFASDVINKNKYTTNNIQKFSEKDVRAAEKESFKGSKNTKKKTKKSWLSKIGSWFKSTFFGSGGRGDDPNYYNQKDPRWANQYFGNYNGRRDTVKEGGCGPTVAAMALQELTGHTVTPSDMANLALRAGYKVDNGGTTPDFFNAAGSMFGYNFDTESGINERTKAALKAGIPVPLLGKNGPYGPGDHYLLANGMDGSGRVSILDPQNKSNNKKFSLNTLSKNTKASMITSGISRMYGRSRNNRYVKRIGGFMGRSSNASSASKMQLKVVQHALNRVGDKSFRSGDLNKGSVKGKCLGVSSDIYAACGYKFVRYSDPREVKTKDPTYSTDISNIPLGATIIWPCKTTHGHCGTYVGDGRVVHAWGDKVVLTPISTVTNAKYNEMGWSWLGGSPMGSASDESGLAGMITSDSSASSNNGGTFIDLINSAIKVSSMNLGIETNPIKLPSLLKTFGSTSSDSSSDGSYVNTSGTNTSSVNLSKKGTINKVYKELKKHGISHDGAIAILANMNAESGFNTGAIGDSGTSYGLCQWHDTRNTALGKFCAANGYNKDSIEGQVAYLVKELNDYGIYSKYSKSGKSSVENAKELSKYFTINFEKPSDAKNKAKYRTAAVDELYSINGSGGRGTPFLKPGTPSAGSVRETINGLVPNISNSNSSSAPTIRVPKYNVQSARGISVSSSAGSIEIPTTKASGNNINQLDLSSVLGLLQNMVEALNDIRNTNAIISEKNTTPVVVNQQSSIPSINFGGSQKAAIVDSIISGI